MPSYLCLTVRFLQPFAHGRRDGGEPEWPPSPLRVFQALVAAAAGRWNERTELAEAAPALRWLEAQPHPEIVAAEAVYSEHPYRLYVPDNVADKVAASWARGQVARSIADYRTEKDVRPTHLAGEAVHYFYALPQDHSEFSTHYPTLKLAARSITHVGWGPDMAVGDAVVLTTNERPQMRGRRWRPATSGGTPLRVPLPGTLDDLIRKHADFLSRLTEDSFRPVPPLKEFRVVSYRRDDDPLQRPYRVFELRRTDGSRSRYPQSRLVHIAGMVRHLAIEAMKASPPIGVEDDWVKSYVAGHAKQGAGEHRQLSYLPLPSIGHRHADPGVRRIMLAASPGDETWLDHVARRLAGRVLRPERGDEFSQRDRNNPPILVPVQHDSVARFYTRPAHTWHSVTPIILPGHDDHKPQKTRKLIERALAQSGVEQPCAFEWSPFSRFPKSLPAHKYDKDKRPTGYIRPEHLLTQTAVHLTLTFAGGLEVPGPLVVGAGRHCGFGLMASSH